MFIYLFSYVYMYVYVCVCIYSRVLRALVPLAVDLGGTKKKRRGTFDDLLYPHIHRTYITAQTSHIHPAPTSHTHRTYVVHTCIKSVRSGTAIASAL